MAAPVGGELIFSAISNLNEVCAKHLEDCKENVYLLRCLESCSQMLLQLKTTSFTDDVGIQCVKGFTQALLDYTYYDESNLVEEEFPESDARERIQTIFKYLDMPVELAAQVLPTKELTDIIGPEMQECILWRKGALLYMYSSTVQEDIERVQKQALEFKQCLEMGVQYLQEMFRVRGPLKGEAHDIITRDQNTYKLLTKGLYTDTHVLALMYGGEMSLWYHKALEEKIFTENNTQPFNAHATALSLLRAYLEAVNGPLIGKGWATERAEEILEEL